MTPTSSMTPSMTPTRSVTSTRTPTCLSADFVAYPRMDLVGTLLLSVSLMDASPFHAQSGGFARPPAQQACEEACCAAPECVGYAAGAFVPAAGFANCFLYANVSELMPSAAFVSGLARAAL